MEIASKLDEYGKPAWITVMVLGFVVALFSTNAMACVGDLVLPKPASNAQIYGFAAGQILGRAEACKIDIRPYERRANREIPRLALSYVDTACAFYGFDHFLANLAYYQERHEMPKCEIVRKLFKETEWSVMGLRTAQRAFHEETAKAVSKRSTAKRFP